MRLTQSLLRQPRRPWFRRLWAKKALLSQPHYIVPDKLAQQGTPIEEMWKTGTTPSNAEWKPPVPDCPVFLSNYRQFRKKPSPHEHPHWHATKAYIYDGTAPLLEGLKQAQWLLQARLVRGLPESLTTLVGKHSLPTQDELAQRAIMQANQWNPALDRLDEERPKPNDIWKFKAEWGTRKRDILRIFSSNAIRIWQMIALQAGGMTPTDVFATCTHTRYHPFAVQLGFITSSSVSAGEGVPLVVRGCVDHLLSHETPLAPATADEQLGSAPPALGPISASIDLLRDNVYRSDDSLGWTPLALRRPRVSRTLWLLDDNRMTVEQNHVRAALFAAAHAVAIARRRAQTMPSAPESPAQPITVQCIHSGVSDIHIVVFQLNNSDLNLDLGAQARASDGSHTAPNVLWVDDGPSQLFNKVVPKRARLAHTKYVDYDPAVMGKLIAALMTNVSRQARAPLPPPKSADEAAHATQGA